MWLQTQFRLKCYFVLLILVHTRLLFLLGVNFPRGESESGAPALNTFSCDPDELKVKSRVLWTHYRRGLGTSLLVATVVVVTVLMVLRKSRHNIH